MPEIDGHCGARALRPENTLPGLAYALAISVDAIEFDVTLTADGGLILAPRPHSPARAIPQHLTHVAEVPFVSPWRPDPGPGRVRA